MRPQGIIRVALREAAQRLELEKGAASIPEIARAAVIHVDRASPVAGEQLQRGVATRLARDTIKNMVRSGELERVGREKPAGSGQWRGLYAPGPRFTDQVDISPPPLLDTVVRSWPRR